MTQVEIFNKAISNNSPNAFSIPFVLDTIMPLEFNDYRLYYCKAVSLHIQNKDACQAKDNIEKAFELFAQRENGVELPHPSIQRMHQLAAEIYSELGIDNAAMYHYNRFYYYSYKNDKTIQNGGVKTVYSYRSFNEYSMHDLLSSEITVGHPSKMNDPFDSIASFLSNSEFFEQICSKKPHIKNQVSSINKFRIRSFVHSREVNPFMSNDDLLSNTLMWTHYADSHRGFCIKYELSDKITHSFQEDSDNVSFSILLPVVYTENKVDIYERLNTQTSFALKKQCWSYENEARLLTFDTTRNGEFVGIPLDDESYISEIIFGYNCSKEAIVSIQKILKDEIGIIYSKMEIKDNDILQLVKTVL